MQCCRAGPGRPTPIQTGGWSQSAGDRRRDRAASENVTAGDVYDPEGVFGDNFALTPAANHPGGSTP